MAHSSIVKYRLNPYKSPDGFLGQHFNALPIIFFNRNGLKPERVKLINWMYYNTSSCTIDYKSWYDK